MMINYIRTNFCRQPLSERQLMKIDFHRVFLPMKSNFSDIASKTTDGITYAKQENRMQYSFKLRHF